MRIWYTTLFIQCLSWGKIADWLPVSSRLYSLVYIVFALVCGLMSLRICWYDCSSWFLEKLRAPQPPDLEKKKKYSAPKVSKPRGVCARQYYIWHYYPRNMVQLVIILGSLPAAFYCSGSETSCWVYTRFIWLSAVDQVVHLILMRGYNPFRWLLLPKSYRSQLRAAVTIPSMHDKMGTVGYSHRKLLKKWEEYINAKSCSTEKALTHIERSGDAKPDWMIWANSHENIEDDTVSILMVVHCCLLAVSVNYFRENASAELFTLVLCGLVCQLLESCCRRLAVERKAEQKANSSQTSQLSPEATSNGPNIPQTSS